jgi:hypothetical protein
MSTARTTQIADLTWTERGPNNIGGRSRAILIDKRDPTRNTVFAASVSGGIFKSTNFTSGSANWTVVDDDMANLAVTALVQDKNNFNIMYAGTGEGWFNVDAVRGAGIFKSTDGGVTWSQLASTAQFEYVQDMVIDNNSNVYASLRSLTSNNRGVVRSVNGGASWSQVLGTPLTDLAYTTSRGADLEVASNGDLYATLGIFSRTMVLKSAFATNGANTGAAGTWTDITPTHSNTTFRGEIAAAPSNPQRLYLMMQDSATDKVLTFYTSSNGGTSWTSTPIASGSPLDEALNNGSSSQTWYDLISAVDSTNANVVVVGGIDLAKSTDGGSTWTAISTGSVHVDQHALVFLNSSNLLTGNDGGIYHTSNFTNAIPTFSQKNNGFNATQFYGCDFHPTDENYFLAGAQDNNTQKFTSSGINSTTPVIGGDGAIPHISQTDGQLQIAASTSNTYYRSTDGGNTFNSLGGSINNGRGQFINPSDLDDNQKVLYAGDDIGKYYCITGLNGTPAASVKPVIEMAGRGLTAVKIDPVAANTIWIGASSVDGSPGLLPPLLIKITNASSAAPTVSFTTTIPAANGSYISSIDVDRFNPNNVLVTFSNFGVTSVWESTDGGATFTSIEGNLPDMPVFCGIFAPPGAQLSGATGGGIILGTDLGIWTTSSVSGFTQWIPNNNGLANVPVYMVKYRSANTSLVAATHGRGLFTTTLAGVVTGVPPNVITKEFIEYISADAAQLLVVKGDLNTLNMQVQIFDATGKLMYNKEHPYQNLSIPISTLSKGSYVVRIQGNNKENFVQQFVKR